MWTTKLLSCLRIQCDSFTPTSDLKEVVAVLINATRIYFSQATRKIPLLRTVFRNYKTVQRKKWEKTNQNYEELILQEKSSSSICIDKKR